MSKSIMQSGNECYLCDLLGEYSIGVQTHHIFGGPNRPISERYGLKVKLCFKHHGSKGKEDVHRPEFNNYGLLLKQKGQQAFEEKYSHELFMKELGKNYL